MPRKSRSSSSKSDPAPQTSSAHSLMLGVVGHAATIGWSPATLATAAAELGVSDAQVKALYPDGIAGVISRFSRHIDALMSDSLAQQDLTTLRVRDRVKTAVLTRLHMLAPYRQAAQRLPTAALSPAGRAALASRLLAWSVDDIWQAAGDQSTGFSHYSKRATLGLIYGATLLFWFQDQSPENSRTATFLENRIDNLMQTGKKISTLKNLLASPFKNPRKGWLADSLKRSPADFKCGAICRTTGSPTLGVNENQ